MEYNVPDTIVPVIVLSGMDIRLPLFDAAVSAGFPSPADDYLQARLSLDELIIRNPSATFFVKVEGHSMTDAGIYPNDILVVDRSKEARPFDVIVAILEGAFTVKRLMREGEHYFLKAENPDYKPIPIDEHSDFMVWGVVIRVIHDPYQLK